MEDPFLNSKPQPQSEAQASEKKKSKPWVALAGVFVILIILLLAGGLYFWWQYNISDYLIKLAPVDSVLYIQARDSFWPWQNTKISDLPFNNFYQWAEETIFSDLDFQKDLLANSSQAALVAMLREDNNLDWAFIFKLRNTRSINLVLEKLPNHQMLAKNILVVATSQPALEKIKEVATGSIFSLATQIDSKKKEKELMNLYLSAKNLKTYLNQNQDWLNKIFSQLIKADIYLSLAKKDSQWQFKIKSDSFDSFSVAEPLVEYLPADFSIFISSINLKEIFEEWGEADYNIAESFEQTAESLKIIYELDLKNSVVTFLDQGADLVIFKQSEDKILGFDYILLLPQVEEEQINNLRDLVKVVLAQKLPKQVDHVLPDGSKVVELLAQPEVWQWEEESLGENLEVNYLNEPALNFEISYLIKDKKIIISSSKQLLSDFILNQIFGLKDLASACEKEVSKNRYLIFNSSLFPGLYLPLGMILVKEDQKGIKGCIVDL